MQCGTFLRQKYCREDFFHLVLKCVIYWWLSMQWFSLYVVCNLFSWGFSFRQRISVHISAYQCSANHTAHCSHRQHTTQVWHIIALQKHTSLGVQAYCMCSVSCTLHIAHCSDLQLHDTRAGFSPPLLVNACVWHNVLHIALHYAYCTLHDTHAPLHCWFLPCLPMPVCLLSVKLAAGLILEIHLIFSPRNLQLNLFR